MAGYQRSSPGNGHQAICPIERRENANRVRKHLEQADEDIDENAMRWDS